MVRTQIQMEEEQIEWLRVEARERKEAGPCGSRSILVKSL